MGNNEEKEIVIEVKDIFIKETLIKILEKFSDIAKKGHHLEYQYIDNANVLGFTINLRNANESYFIGVNKEHMYFISKNGTFIKKAIKVKIDDHAKSEEIKNKLVETYLCNKVYDVLKDGTLRLYL